MLSQKIRTMVGVTLACCLTASLTMSAAYAVDAEPVTTTTQSTQARNNDFSIQGANISGNQLTMGVYSTENVTSDSVTIYNGNSSAWWSSSDNQVASAYTTATRTSTISFGGYSRTMVQIEGTIQGHAAGEADITLHIGDYSSTVHVTVRVIPVDSVHITENDFSMYIGDSTTLSTYVSPSNATNQNVTLTSSDPSVISVNGNELTARKLGTAKITATAGDKSTSITVTVAKRPVDTVTIQGKAVSNGTLQMSALSSSKLSATVSPANATDRQVTWKSSDDKVASVAADGTWRYGGMTFVYRQDMAAFLERIAKLAHKASGIKPKTDFTDVVEGKTAHYKEIEWLGGSGIAQGYRNPNGTWRFEGMTPTYRQDMAAFIQRLNELLER